MTNIEEYANRIFEGHPARFNRKEKTAFLDTVKSILREGGYSENEIKEHHIKGMMDSCNLVVGDPSAPYVITAHYDTPGRNGFLLSSSRFVGQVGANIVFFLESLLIPLFIPLLVMLLITTVMSGFMTDIQLSVDLALLSLILFCVLFIILMFAMFIKNKNNRNDNTSGSIGVIECALMAARDPELKKQYCFILFDNEEWGLIGSAQHKNWCMKNKIKVKDSLYINMDCIGVGSKLIAARASRKGEKYKRFIGAMQNNGADITEKKSSLVYMSDHANFPESTMLCYMNRSSLGPLYIPNIHSSKDTECDLSLVADLSSRVIKATKQCAEDLTS